MVHDDVPVGLDGVGVRFDDQRAVADAGIAVAVTLADRPGVEALVDETVDLGERPGAANAGAKVMTLALGDGAWRRFDRRLRRCWAPGGRAWCSATGWR